MGESFGFQCVFLLGEKNRTSGEDLESCERIHLQPPSCFVLAVPSQDRGWFHSPCNAPMLGVRHESTSEVVLQKPLGQDLLKGLTFSWARKVKDLEKYFSVFH